MEEVKEMEEVKDLDEEVEETDVGEVLDLTADENNPVSDGKEYKDE
jgi:hypothetical protein